MYVCVYFSSPSLYSKNMLTLLKASTQLYFCLEYFCCTILVSLGINMVNKSSFN